jgi:hypothetical protein
MWSSFIDGAAPAAGRAVAGGGTATERARAAGCQRLAGRPFLWQMPQTVAFNQAVEFLSKVGGVIAGALEGLGH